MWVMDSFQGLPPANRSFWDRAAGDLSQFDFLSVSQQEVSRFRGWEEREIEGGHHAAPPPPHCNLHATPGGSQL